MKKITLHCIIDKQKNTVRTNLNRYRIFLTWGSTSIFKNKKKAAIFQAALNIWVNDTFYELNNIYSNLLYQHRVSWLFTTSELDDVMQTNFRSIELNIQKLYRSDFRGADGIFYAFSTIETLSSELQSCCQNLIAHYHFKRDWERIKELNIISIQIKRIIKELLETSEPVILGQKSSITNTERK